MEKIVRANKKGVKRTVMQRENDLVDVARLYLGGSTQKEIAEFISETRPYSLTRQMIGQDLKVLHHRWSETSLRDYDAARMRELMKIDRLESEAWEAWESSRKPGWSVETVAIDDKTMSARGETKPTYSRRKAKRLEEHRDGDIRFLQTIQWCVQQRCKILGLNAPTKIDVDWRKQAEQQGYDPAEVFNTLIGKFIEQGEQGPPQQGTQQEPPDQDGQDDTDSDE